MAHRDSAATRERIVAAAFEEFTESGFAGARVDRIAERANVNKSLLYQYFGDKERLFQHVLESKLTELGSLALDPKDVAQAIGTFFDFHARNPWMIRLMLWEALDFGTHPIPNEPERRRQLCERVEALEHAQAAGLVDPSLDARQTVVTLIGLVGSWFAFPQVARIICGGDPYSRKALAQRRDHLQEFARRILEVR